MTGTGYDAFHRREFLLGASAAVALSALPGAALAQASADPASEAVRRLMVLSTQNALAQLAQPNGFLNSAVARFNLPVLFAAKKAPASSGPLGEPAFRLLLQQRLNVIAEAGARGAAPTMAEASRKLPIVDPNSILRGRSTAATSALRLEMGSGLVNALRGPLEQALIAAQDVTVSQAIAALPGVTLGDVAHAVALAADNGIWYEIGAAEADIRANPSATGDAALIAALAQVRVPVTQPAVPQPPVAKP